MFPLTSRCGAGWCRTLSPVVLAAALALAGAPAAAQSLDSARAYAERVVGQQDATAYLIALRVPGRADQVVAVGHTDTSRRTPVSAATRFEIGSVTKTFTATLLAQLVVAGKLALDSNIGPQLPPEAAGFAAHGVTWRHLATHRAGLPEFPGDLGQFVRDPYDPFAAYPLPQLWRNLGSLKPTSTPGSRFAYSNYGYSVLGHLVAKVQDKPYADALAETLLQPLGLRDTYLPPDDEAAVPPNTAHADGGYAKLWHLGPFAPAGALRSTANDLLRYLDAQMNPPAALAAAVRLAHTPTAEAFPGTQVGLAWFTHTEPSGKRIVFHTGGTAGTRCVVAFDPDTKRSVVVWTNSTAEVRAVALYLLGAAAPLPKLPVIEPRPAGELAPLVGYYEVTPQFGIRVWQQGGYLFGQATGQPRFRLLPAEGPMRYRINIVPAEIEFRDVADNQARQLVLYQNGQTIPGTRRD